jgi:hypothetical protein
VEKVFVVTLGMAPAVITETLWALLRRDPPWRPDRIEVITTTGGARSVAKDLLRSGGPMHSLFEPHPVPPVSLHVPAPGDADGPVRSLRLDWTGHTLTESDLARLDGAHADVASETEASDMGDLILLRIWETTRCPDNQLHLSIAGGRKTMSAHALYSLGLVGNPQDEASHVLIGKDFDGNGQFFHPGQGGLIHTVAEQRAHGAKVHELCAPTLDPAEAADSLRLMSIAAAPFMGFPKVARDKAPPRLSTILGHTAIAAAWQRERTIRLDPATNAVTIGGHTARVSAMSFVWLRALATARRDGWTFPGAIPDQHDGTLSIRSLMYGEPDLARVQKLGAWYREAIDAAMRDIDPARRRGAEGQLRREENDAFHDAVEKDVTYILNQPDRKKRDERIELFGDDIRQRIASLTKLRADLERWFGAPLAEALIPRKDPPLQNGRRRIEPAPLGRLKSPALTIPGLAASGVHIMGEP